MHFRVSKHALTVSIMQEDREIIIKTDLFGGIPYGWNLVSKVTRYFEWILFLPIMGWLIYFGVKLMASMCCGWFFFGRECLVRIKAKGGRG